MNTDSLFVPSTGGFEVYLNGQIHQKGKLISSDKFYDCVTDLNLIKHGKSFELFINYNGDTLVKNGNGYVKISLGSQFII